MNDRLLKLRCDVHKANLELARNGLVTAHSGNASGYSPVDDVIFIKPSGINYESMTELDIVGIELNSQKQISSDKIPSVDLPHHVFLYQNMPGIAGIIHTHSNYATAFAALEMPIPAILTSIADEFGGDIPCAPYVDNSGDKIGRSILSHKTDSPSILLGHHGVFSWGETVESALKAAVMTEDAARTVWLAMQIGQPQRLPDIEVVKWHDRYQNRYGQNRNG